MYWWNNHWTDLLAAVVFLAAIVVMMWLLSGCGPIHFHINGKYYMDDPKAAPPANVMPKNDSDIQTPDEILNEEIYKYG